MKKLKNQLDVVDMCNHIFQVATIEEASQSEIDHYEELYKVYVYECLDDVIKYNNYSSREYSHFYNYFKNSYNPNNLVHYFKNVFDEKEKA